MVESASGRHRRRLTFPGSVQTSPWRRVHRNDQRDFRRRAALPPARLRRAGLERRGGVSVSLQAAGIVAGGRLPRYIIEATRIALRRSTNQKMTKTFEGLDAFTYALDLMVHVYKVTETFPRREWYGLASQM